MPFCLRGAVSVCLSVVTAWVSLPSASHGEQVWSGLTYSFTKPAFADATSPDNQDRITPNAWLTRDNNRGLFNASSEVAYQDFYSPEFTLWATGVNNPEDTDVVATNWAELNFAEWQTAYGGPGALGANIVGTNAVLYLILDEIYLDIQFTNWGVGTSSGGAFAYMRAEPPTLEPTGDYNGNHIVDATDYTIWRDTLGSMTDLRANGDDTGLSAGVIDNADYDYWKARFGDMVPGSASASLVPEPASVVLVAVAAWFLSAIRTYRSISRRPS
jgi:hypothetical protein